MNKLFFTLSILVIVSPLFSQNTNSQITDYFPLGVGNTWAYANDSGKTTEVITMRNSMPDNVSNDGTSLYLFERQFVGIGSGSTLYSIKQNKVVIMVEKNIFGQYQQKSSPFPILASAGQEWRYNDRGDDLRYKTSKSSCVFDGKTFNDCILVEEQIVGGGNVLRTKRSYYAKGVGLVYVTLQGQGESESVYQKLESCNFTNIQEENEEKEEPLPSIQSEENNHVENEAIQDQNDIIETERLDVTDSDIEHTATGENENKITVVFYIGYSYAMNLPIGINLGLSFDKLGFYFSFSHLTEHTDWPTIDDPSNPLEKQEDHITDVMFGLSYRITNNLFVKVGGGSYAKRIYGLFNVQGETNPVWCNIGGRDGISFDFALEAGLMYSFKWFYLSAGYRQYFDEKYTPSFYAGAGFSLGSNTLW
ncbi:MAG: transporter [Treponema sp.]|jgi:hypothetical protein|nr:transporter [Treponema sp.]